ncbi:MAG: hypothetical protein QNJ85_07600 [Gammaproteobacteria bacterium]|nr:hypothetical protein [Gammaproteobacteria bacterium]
MAPDIIEREKTEMQCYQTIAATTMIARIFETLPAIEHRLSHAEIAEWMAQNYIEPEDVLFTSPDDVKAKLASLFEDNRTRIPRAA